jgi:hypothetical protein
LLINQIINKRLKNDFKCLKKIQYQTEVGGALMPWATNYKNVKEKKTLVLNMALNKQYYGEEFLKFTLEWLSFLKELYSLQ